MPAAVGVDIGCGMVAQETTLEARHLPDSLAAIRDNRLRAGAIGIDANRRLAAIYVVAAAYAGVAGALVPIMMRRLGQDPATASSIVLTTVTDVCGFFSFLGIATALSGLL